MDLEYLPQLKKILLGLLVLGVLGVLGYYGYKLYPRNSYYETTPKLASEDFSWIGEDKQFLVIRKDHNAAIGSSFVADDYVRRKHEKPETYTLEADEYLKVDLYDLRSPDFRKETLDLSRLDLGPGYEAYFAYNHGGLFDIEDQSYLRLILAETGVGKTDKMLLYNIRTQEISEISKEVEAYIEATIEDINQDYKLTQYALYSVYLQESDGDSRPTLYDYLRNQLDINPNGRTLYFGEYSSEIEGTNFAALYPDVVEGWKSEAFSLTAPMDKMDSATWFNTLIYWFAPAGQEVLELDALEYDVTVTPAKVMYETPVRNFADYQKWLATYPIEEGSDVNKED